MELGVAVSGYKEVIEAAYDLPSLSKSVDFLSAMTYDYHGGWERATGHHTPIVPKASDPLAYYSIVSIMSTFGMRYLASICVISEFSEFWYNSVLILLNCSISNKSVVHGRYRL